MELPRLSIVGLDPVRALSNAFFYLKKLFANNREGKHLEEIRSLVSSAHIDLVFPVDRLTRDRTVGRLEARWTAGHIAGHTLIILAKTKRSQLYPAVGEVVDHDDDE